MTNGDGRRRGIKMVLFKKKRASCLCGFAEV